MIYSSYFNLVLFMSQNRRYNTATRLKGGSDMGWFKNNQSSQSVPKTEPEYSLGRVRALLDDIGQTRIQITAPRLKVLLTLIAQNGEPFLVRNSPDGKPSDSDIMQFQENLKAVVRVLEQYVIIQNDFGYPSRVEHLQEGFDAVDGFAARVLSKATPSGTQSMTNFGVDTKILSAQRFS